MVVIEKRKEGREEVASGVALQGDRFSDVLLKGAEDTRCDLRLPLEGPVVAALSEAFGKDTSPLSMMVEKVLGKKAVLRELASLMSSPGSHRQVAHADTPWQKQHVLLNCFMALQDVDEGADLGPTVFLPRTHTEE